MGLGRRLHQRNLTYEVTGTGKHAGMAPQVFEVLTDGVPGAPWAVSDAGPYSGQMSLPGAWRAATLMSDLIGGLPWHAFRDAPGGGPAQRLLPTPTFLAQPCPPDPTVVTFSSVALDLIWHGNAVGLYVGRNRDGWPTAMALHPAETVGVKRVEGNERDRELRALPSGTPVYRIKDRWYHWRDVWHAKGTCRPGALRGLGVLEQHQRGALALARALSEQAGGVADHAVPSMVVKSLDPNLDGPGAQELKDAVMRSQRTRQPLVLNPTTDVEPLAWNPTETQLIEARKLSLLELALIFGLDPYWLGASQTSRVYTNAEQEAINLWRYSALHGLLTRIEHTLSSALPRGTWAKANLDSVMRADVKTRMETHEIAIRAGVLSRDEARELEDRPPLTAAQRAELMPSPAPAPAADDDPDDEQDPAAGDDEGARANWDGNAENLHHYWTKGAGLAKWATSAHPYTALFKELSKYITDTEKAQATAAKWHKEVLGFWPGDHGDGKGKKGGKK